MNLARPRGRVGLYAAAFVLMLAGGAALAAAALGSLTSLRLLWISAGCSAAAIAVAVASVLASRR